MQIDQLDYDLPDQLIATHPAEPRDAARLMVVHRKQNEIEHKHVSNLPDLLNPGDLLLVNESKVLPAYLEAVRHGTGGKVTGLFLHTVERGDWQVMLESGGKLREGELIHLDHETSLELIKRYEGGQWQVRPQTRQDPMTVLMRLGKTPLPPYIRRAREKAGMEQIIENDANCYNTVYASNDGSVAAPTAGLHFTTELVDQLKSKGIGWATVTLHVGIGTFMPIRTEDVEQHQMHQEWFDVPEAAFELIQRTRQLGGRVIPVGTTTVRALESLPDSWAHQSRYSGTTDLFIRPDNTSAKTEKPWPFRFTDALMTNFHLPRSTLLALVAALPDVGLKRLKHWYSRAIESQYRFYSYGDAMLLL